MEEALSRRNGSGCRTVSMIDAMDILSGRTGRVRMILPCSDEVVELAESVYGLLSCVGMDIKKKGDRSCASIPLQDGSGVSPSPPQSSHGY